uniref:galactose ABC transporter substrate-binding protein n=1 Tax=Dysosmobacter sp. TaxID=2591382 RepID=UPI003AB80CC6
TQLEQVDRLITWGCDVLCVNIVDRTAAAVLIDKAEEAGVPLIFFNRQPVAEDMERWDQLYYVGARAEEGGILQGQLVLKAWLSDRERLDKNGDGILQYVMLEGEPGHQDALLRTEFCISTLANAGVSAEKLASDAANWQRGQASVSMRQWLQEFGENIEVVFANNDDMALGAIDACAEAGLDKRSMPFIVGVDATPPALEALREGTLKGTVRNDAVGLAESMMELAVSLSVDGEPSQDLELTDERYVWLRYEAVTAESLEDQAVS